ncbi:MAG: hypothetical protein J6A22_07575 [Bacteroidales bacterium]|nr:hypothetical protein [Bacteroidales bacterium]
MNDEIHVPPHLLLIILPAIIEPDCGPQDIDGQSGNDGKVSENQLAATG